MDTYLNILKPIAQWHLKNIKQHNQVNLHKAVHHTQSELEY